MKFLIGDTIDLCAPQDSDFEIWASWFNDSKITSFLEQGIFPNSINDQKFFYKQAISEGRFIAMVKAKDGNLLGVTSISEINFQKKSCQISNVTPIKSKDAVLAPLEARALIVKHAFETMGMERVWASNCFPGLIQWVLKYQTLGFKVEGFTFEGFRKGEFTSDTIRLSILKSDYDKLKSYRGGSLWMGTEKMLQLVKKSRKQEKKLVQLHKSIKDFSLL